MLRERGRGESVDWTYCVSALLTLVKARTVRRLYIPTFSSFFSRPVICPRPDCFRQPTALECPYVHIAELDENRPPPALDSDGGRERPWSDRRENNPKPRTKKRLTALGPSSSSSSSFEYVPLSTSFTHPPPMKLGSGGGGGSSKGEGIESNRIYCSPRAPGTAKSLDRKKEERKLLFF